MSDPAGTTTSPGRVRRLVPIVGWLRTYDRSWLRGDLIAGVTVAALIVPKNLGYAGIAGIPLQNGLYAAAAGAILYAIFGTCRQISMGPSSGLAAVAASAVVAAGITDETGRRVVRRRASPWRRGCCSWSSRCCRMGWIAQFLSRAVVTGFLFGAAIDVVIGELPKLTGTDVYGHQLVPGAVVVAAARSADAHGATVVVGGVSLAGRLRAARGRAAGPGCARAGRRRPARVVAVRPRRPRASRSSATCRAACRRSRVPGLGADVGPRRHGRGRGGRAAC